MFMKNSDILAQALNLRRYPVPRVRHHVSPQLYLPLEQQHVRPAWYPPLRTQADWTAWFANGAPANVVDLGCGRGGFLLAHALAHPELNILGIEVRKVLVEWINTVIQGEHLPNVHAVWYSAVNGLHWIPDHSVQYITYLFADPWPKKRHHKRRLFSVELIDELDRILVEGGRIYLATDVAEVEEQQRATFAAHGRFTLRTVSAEHPWPFPFVTDQQDFCDRKGIPYTMMIAERTISSAPGTTP